MKVFTNYQQRQLPTKVGKETATKIRCCFLLVNTAEMLQFYVARCGNYIQMQIHIHIYISKYIYTYTYIISLFGCSCICCSNHQKLQLQFAPLFCRLARSKFALNNFYPQKPNKASSPASIGNESGKNQLGFTYKNVFIYIS